MRSLLLNEIIEATDKGFNKTNKSLYLRLHLQAFPLSEIDENCPRCVEKAFNRLLNYKNKEMAKDKKDTSTYKFKKEFAGNIVFVIGYGQVNTLIATDKDIKNLVNLGHNFLFDVEEKN